MNRIKENEIYDNFQDLCNSHKEISNYGDKHICNTKCPLRDTNRCENVFFYQQGRADERENIIEEVDLHLREADYEYDSNMGIGDNIGSALLKEYAKGYGKGEQDGKADEAEVKAHDERVIREFIKLLCENYTVLDNHNEEVSVDDLLWEYD